VCFPILFGCWFSFFFFFFACFVCGRLEEFLDVQLLLGNVVVRGRFVYHNENKLVIYLFSQKYLILD
jgi:hypothetical protein